MANTTVRGFRWVRSLLGGSSNEPPIVRVRLASGYTPQLAASGTYNLKAGDPVTQLSTGYHAVSTGTETTTAGSNDMIFGVVAGFAPIYNATTGRMEAVNQFAGGGGVYGSNYENMSYAYVIPVADQVFEVDCDDGAAANDTLAEFIALVGQNADHVLTTGSTPDLNPLLDISTANTTAGLQWRILDLGVNRVDADPTVTRYKVQVVCNKIQFAGSPATFATAT